MYLQDFGTADMVDAPLREGPKPTSKQVGRAQGIYGFATQQELGMTVALSFGFTDGVYNGRSLTVVGSNHPMRLVGEVPVVGGTSTVFGFIARGVAVLKTYAFNTSLNAIVEYNVTVVHYSPKEKC
ncbi:hypothetical protein Scep_000361 [Stephania cephalantha]|uniref:Dirigent protein n=1 Tax=Stephania cephalantha TaxID=152367 RepID=A0AAP0L6X1_9MAGN